LNETPEKAQLGWLLGMQRLAVLATQQEAQPFTHLIAFAVTEDLKQILFTTTRDTAKYADIIRRPGVSLLIDNGSRDSSDFSRAAAVTVLGQARELMGAEKDGGLPVFLSRQPALRPFALQQGTALIGVTVEKYILVRHFPETSSSVILP
jgi:nitroimidazol reductase NimA-like FMN-containing flavoprotein (pyridoxamine 5'-phosphate oxidase superfamily)